MYVLCSPSCLLSRAARLLFGCLNGGCLAASLISDTTHLSGLSQPPGRQLLCLPAKQMHTDWDWLDRPSEWMDGRTDGQSGSQPNRLAGQTAGNKWLCRGTNACTLSQRIYGGPMQHLGQMANLALASGARHRDRMIIIVTAATLTVIVFDCLGGADSGQAKPSQAEHLDAKISSAAGPALGLRGGRVG